MIMIRTVLLLALMLFSFVGGRPALAVCGDCNGDGSVRINELVTAVNNALGSAVAVTPSPTPLPDRCPQVQPGQRLRAFGADYVIVEVEVSLEGSSREYLLRHPVKLDDDGNLSATPPHIYLRRTCFAPDFSCPYVSGQLGSICGFRSAVDAHTLNNSSYYEYTTSGQKKAELTLTPFVRGTATIIVDSAYSPVYVTIDEYTLSQSTVTQISQFGFSFAAANYPEPQVQSGALQEMRRLLDNVSIKAE